MHPTEEDLVMLYYREAAEDVRAHLEACPECQVAYRNLVRVLDACDDLPVPEPHAAFESRMWHRIEPQLRGHQSRSRWLVFAAAAAMLAVAFLAGRMSRPPREIPIAISAEGRQRVLEMALSEHLERSQMVLTEFANNPDAVTGERARNLIDENRLYRQTAADHGDRALAQVLDELERVLLDVSHGSDPEEVKSRIKSESLLFKLQVLESHLNRSEEHL